jgi:hypothetical protein
MKKKLNINPFDVMKVNEEKDNKREYPLYPDNEDIYSKYKKEDELDPEDISKVKKSSMEVVSDFENDLNNNESGSDLDIPGSELDDEQENAGNED